MALGLESGLFQFIGVVLPIGGLAALILLNGAVRVG